MGYDIAWPLMTRQFLLRPIIVRYFPSANSSPFFVGCRRRRVHPEKGTFAERAGHAEGEGLPVHGAATLRGRRGVRTCPHTDSYDGKGMM